MFSNLLKLFREAHPLYTIRNTHDAIRVIMQNKPNFLQCQLSITSFIKEAYRNICFLERRKNKPNSNPIEPNFKAKKNEKKFIEKHFKCRVTPRLIFVLDSNVTLDIVTK